MKRTKSNTLRSVSQDDITYWRPFPISLFIRSHPNSITAAHAMWCTARMNVWSPSVCPDSGKVAGGLLARDQSKVKAVLPSDCPHVVCQGRYLQRKGSAKIKGRLPALNPAVTRFPVHLARGNICPSHWTEPKISSRPYLEMKGWWEWCISHAHHSEEEKRNSTPKGLGMKYQNLTQWKWHSELSLQVVTLFAHYFAPIVNQFSNIPAWSAPFVLSDSLFTAPWVFSRCQPDSTVNGG